MTAWTSVGLLIYFGYGYRNSVLRNGRGSTAKCTPVTKCICPQRRSMAMIVSRDCEGTAGGPLSIESALDRTHPDVSHSADPADPPVLARAFDDVRLKLDRPMTAEEAWKVMSGLNPVMADGHLTVAYPGGAAAEIQRHLKSGGACFRTP